MTHNGSQRSDHVDVLIVGAGLSGIGAACHLRMDCPDKTFAILEARDAMGGTWDLFRYPGIRSDSDMFTLGYRFRPWKEARTIADGPAIRSYIQDTAREYDVEREIRYGHRLVRADWSSAEARWSATIERTDGTTAEISCGFLHMCSGYYRYDEGYTPHFEGTERFGGQIIHPQHWPEDLDYDGKRVVVIGSGATAVTLLPAMAARAGHVTMLQRSPSYFLSIPQRDPLAALLRRVVKGDRAFSLVRWKNALLGLAFFTLCRRRPRLMRKLLRSDVARRLPDGYPIDPNFRPSYKPWDQRMCIVPDGDLFDAIGSGRASVVTDGIETFTEKGLLLASGDELEADIVITATGLNLATLGGAELAVDGRAVDFSQTVGYKGMMFSGVPNMAMTIGYTNASWTLKADLVSQYVCRLLRHMDERGLRVVTPRAPDPSIPTLPFIDLQSGYVARAIDSLPRQGQTPPWRLHQNYVRDVLMVRRGPLEDEGIEFSDAGAPAGDAPSVAA